MLTEYDRKTPIPEKRCLVSTVSRFGVTETRAWLADENGEQIGWTDLYVEHHAPGRTGLDKAHERIVAGIRSGQIELDTDHRR